MKFRRRSEQAEPTVDETAATEPPEGTAEPRQGPFDIDEVAGDGVQRIDLGSLLLAPEPDRELRLQVDERTQAVQAVVLAGRDGALELRAFAAPRNGDLWTEIRPKLAADMARRGGTATEQEGPFGTELACQLAVQSGDGRTATQPSRIIGINGPRWMLRGTLLGRPAVDADSATSWEQTLSHVVVRRGEHAMPVGDPLPVAMPPDARRVGPAEA